MYAVSGVGIYLFFVIGVLLASFLANRLSRAVARMNSAHGKWRLWKR